MKGFWPGGMGIVERFGGFEVADCRTVFSRWVLCIPSVHLADVFNTSSSTIRFFIPVPIHCSERSRDACQSTVAIVDKHPIACNQVPSHIYLPIHQARRPIAVSIQSPARLGPISLIISGTMYLQPVRQPSLASLEHFLATCPDRQFQHCVERCQQLVSAAQLESQKTRRKKQLRSSQNTTAMPAVPDADELIATGDRAFALAAVRKYRRAQYAEAEPEMKTAGSENDEKGSGKGGCLACCVTM
jgi:hypothetical protein